MKHPVILWLVIVGLAITAYVMIAKAIIEADIPTWIKFILLDRM